MLLGLVTVVHPFVYLKIGFISRVRNRAVALLANRIKTAITVATMSEHVSIGFSHDASFLVSVTEINATPHFNRRPEN